MSSIFSLTHSKDLRGNLIHNFRGRVLDGVLQVVLEVAEELSSTSFNHVQQSTPIVPIQICKNNAF